MAVEPMWLGHTKFSGWWQAGVLWLASRRMAAQSPLLIRRCSWVNWRQLSPLNNAGTCSMVAAARQHNCSAPRHTLCGREGLLIINVRKSGPPVTGLGDGHFCGSCHLASTLRDHRPPEMKPGGSYALSQQTECLLVVAAASYGDLQHTPSWQYAGDLLQQPLVTCSQRLKAHL